MNALPALVPEAAGEAAAAETFELVVIEGGLATGAETAVVGTEAALLGAEGAVVGAEVAAGGVAAGGAAVGVGAVVATAGVALVVIGVVALGVYLYSRRDKTPSRPKVVQKCPEPGEYIPEPLPNPAPKPKPVQPNPMIPDSERRRIDAEKREINRQKFDCAALWEKLRDKASRFRTKAVDGTAGLKFRRLDQICSQFDPNTSPGDGIWEEHNRAYKEQRNGLKRDIDEFEEKCEAALPKGAKETSKEEPPEKSEWQGGSAWCQQYRAERDARRAAAGP